MPFLSRIQNIPYYPCLQELATLKPISSSLWFYSHWLLLTVSSSWSWKSTYILWLLQRIFSRYVLLDPVPPITEQDNANSVVKCVAEHGIPRTILSDNHRSFSGNLFATFTRTLTVNPLRLIKTLYKSFLALVGYYRSFIKNFPSLPARYTNFYRKALNGTGHLRHKPLMIL